MFAVLKGYFKRRSERKALEREKVRKAELRKEYASVVSNSEICRQRKDELKSLFELYEEKSRQLEELIRTRSAKRKGL